MTTEPPGSLVTEGVCSLEARWIFAGQLETSVIGWFARFPTRTESREDTYLLDPQLRGLSVKVRGGAALEVKAYRGSPGILDVHWPRPRTPGCPGRSGRFLSPLSQDGTGPAGWRLVLKGRRISQFSLTSGQTAARGPRLIQEPRCEVELTGGPHQRPALVDPGIPRRPAPPICCAANLRPPPRSCSPTPCRAEWNPDRMNPGPTRSGSASCRTAKMTATLESQLPSHAARGCDGRSS